MTKDQTTRIRDATPVGEDVTPELRVIAGSRAGHVETLSRSPLIIGKSPDADLCVTDTGVSRQHAKLTISAAFAVTVFDLGSTNGTFVNGTRVSVAAVHPADKIRLGPVACVELHHRPDAAPKRVTLEDSPLSARQLEVARLVARGMTNAEVARRLAIRPGTVKSHLDHIYSRLELRSRTALALWLAKLGLLDA